MDQTQKVLQGQRSDPSLGVLIGHPAEPIDQWARSFNTLEPLRQAGVQPEPASRGSPEHVTFDPKLSDTRSCSHGEDVDLDAGFTSSAEGRAPLSPAPLSLSLAPALSPAPLSLSLAPALSPEDFERVWMQRRSDQGPSGSFMDLRVHQGPSGSFMDLRSFMDFRVLGVLHGPQGPRGPSGSSGSFRVLHGPQGPRGPSGSFMDLRVLGVLQGPRGPCLRALRRLLTLAFTPPHTRPWRVYLYTHTHHTHTGSSLITGELLDAGEGEGGVRVTLRQQPRDQEALHGFMAILSSVLHAVLTEQLL
ncbi:hypothetical protein EYF80_057881 [Liparis tanakae]|uniref:Uncharacterized protein n=1 Tax=Liparis tanakae TaxID=230148 RepID=A0A4Z2ET41_9TELE|nr:hypothetical protein EYF80_057881 [Liparis tanakae]